MLRYRFENVKGFDATKLDDLLSGVDLNTFDYNASTGIFIIELVANEALQEDIETLMLAETGEVYATKEVIND